MAEEEKEARIHPWVYYIAPVPASQFFSDRMMFTAFCKGCRQYFMEEIPFPGSGTTQRMSPSHLPRYGCKPISEDVQALG